MTKGKGKAAAGGEVSTSQELVLARGDLKASRLMWTKMAAGKKMSHLTMETLAQLMVVQTSRIVDLEARIGGGPSATAKKATKKKPALAVQGAAKSQKKKPVAATGGPTVKKKKKAKKNKWLYINRMANLGLASAGSAKTGKKKKRPKAAPPAGDVQSGSTGPFPWPQDYAPQPGQGGQWHGPPSSQQQHQHPAWQQQQWDQPVWQQGWAGRSFGGGPRGGGGQAYVYSAQLLCAPAPRMWGQRSYPSLVGMPQGDYSSFGHNRCNDFRGPDIPNGPNACSDPEECNGPFAALPWWPSEPNRGYMPTNGQMETAMNGRGWSDMPWGGPRLLTQF